MKAIPLLLLLLLLPAKCRGAASACGEIEAEFALLARLDFPRCPDADHTRSRFAVQMPELLRGCRELAAFDLSLGLKLYREQSSRFRNRVIYELLASPADDKEFQHLEAGDQLCQAELAPLMRFRKQALEKLNQLDDNMEIRIHEKAPASPEANRERKPDPAPG